MKTKQIIKVAQKFLNKKVPNKKTQIEQITVALIYKLINEMDKESEKLGGKAVFFAGEFAYYSWEKLKDNKLTEEERLNFYIDAIKNMSRNPYIPQFFRTIFSDTRLPYYDPHTFSLFLEQIEKISSKDIKKTCEHLLSELKEQGEVNH
jgi:type I restriction enzyme M protein